MTKKLNYDNYKPNWPCNLTASFNSCNSVPERTVVFSARTEEGRGQSCTLGDEEYKGMCGGIRGEEREAGAFHHYFILLLTSDKSILAIWKPGSWGIVDSFRLFLPI